MNVQKINRVPFSVFVEDIGKTFTFQLTEVEAARATTG